MSFYDLNNIGEISVQFQLITGNVAQCRFLLDCRSGYSIFGEVLDNVTVELKHSLEVSYSNIETTPYDTTPFDGSREAFDLRFTSPTPLTKAEFYNVYHNLRQPLPFTLTMRRPT